MSDTQDGLKGISPEDVVLLKDVVLSRGNGYLPKIAENTKILGNLTVPKLTNSETLFLVNLRRRQ